MESFVSVLSPLLISKGAWRSPGEVGIQFPTRRSRRRDFNQFNRQPLLLACHYNNHKRQKRHTIPTLLNVPYVFLHIKLPLEPLLELNVSSGNLQIYRIIELLFFLETVRWPPMNPSSSLLLMSVVGWMSNKRIKIILKLSAQECHPYVQERYLLLLFIRVTLSGRWSCLCLPRPIKFL